MKRQYDDVVEPAMKMLTTTILADGFVYLKAARWHAGSLWISDKVGRKVYCLNLDGNAKVVADVPGQPAGLGFLPDGTLLVASIMDRRLLRSESGRFICHADLSSITAGELSNMIVDRQGRAFVTSFSFETAGPQSFRTASVIVVTSQGTARVVADHLVRPRGLAIAGGRELLIAETFANRLKAFQIAEDGSLLQRRLFANLEEMSPEGICVDAEGAVWAAAAHQALFVRIRQGGQITDRIHVPGRRAVSCQLGGPEGRNLFCLTLAKNFEDYPNQRATARVEVVMVDVPGAGWA